MTAEIRRSLSAASLDAGESTRGKHRHSKRSTKVLKDWLASYAAHPYPSEYEKEQLSKEICMSTRQISYWFVNARRRQMTNKDAEPEAREEKPGTSPSALLFATPTVDPGAIWSDMAPLDRWRHSPPEQEPAQWDAITRSLGDGFASFSSEPCPSRLAMPALNDISDTSSLSMSSGSASSAYSYHSSNGLAVLDQRNNRPRRRRRRLDKRSGRRQKPLKDLSKDKNRPFQCTFCTDRFHTRYDWTRHEGTVHLVLEKWTCLALGPTYVDLEKEGPIRCSMCDEGNPSDQHLQSHRTGDCMIKPMSQRSFYRRDHLRQHLRANHNVGSILPSMKLWKTKVTRLKSRCGFCGDVFSAWSERNDHISDHFRSGAHMKDWKGCRGLEPAVALLVQNAMPPYLIGTESNDFEPFSGSRVADQTGLPTQFESLTAHLGDFVTRIQAEGAVVTCDMLRLEARLFLYGDDDPLNHTPADNQAWMAMFAQGYGIQCTTVENPQFPQRESGECTTSTHVPSPIVSFPLTLKKMQQAAAYHSASVSMDPSRAPMEGHLGSGMAIPWSWQTAECLAEFSQMCDTQQTCEGGLDLPLDIMASEQLHSHMNQPIPQPFDFVLGLSDDTSDKPSLGADAMNAPLDNEWMGMLLQDEVFEWEN